mmetsp:Transcript_34161/g.74633  ORF Transcript_34161/g.74633 Transcript_34161/m.74633 type:complete len:451 (-) Transcript_34161:71-1423(-)
MLSAVSDVYDGQSLVSWSPDGLKVSCIAQNRLILRTHDSLDIVQVFNCADKVDRTEWSPDSEYILCQIGKRGVTEVWSASDSEWRCRIDEGLAGLARSRFAPSSREIVTVADFQVRIAVWCLVTACTRHLRSPKWSDRGMAFSNGEAYMAILTRKELRDGVAIFDVQTWEEVQSFALSTTDAADLAWSYRDSSLVVWETPLDCALHVYSLRGEMLHSVLPASEKLGIRTLKLAKEGLLAAVACYDETAKIVHSNTWKVLVELPHSDILRNDPSVKFFKEELRDGHAVNQHVYRHGGSAPSRPSAVEYVETELKGEAVTLPSIPKPETADKVGVSMAIFSEDGTFLATKNERHPCVVWVWDMHRLALHSVLVHRFQIRSMDWDSSAAATGSQCRLAVATGSQHVFFWTPSETFVREVPRNDFFVHRVKWRPLGPALVVAMKDRFCTMRVDS